MPINIIQATDNDKKLKGQITTNENEEESRVDCSVYKQLLMYSGGYKGLLVTNFCMTGFITTKVAADWLFGQWSTSPDQFSHFNYYCRM
jgi:hypothetical protein